MSEEQAQVLMGRQRELMVSMWRSALFSVLMGLEVALSMSGNGGRDRVRLFRGCGEPVKHPPVCSSASALCSQPVYGNFDAAVCTRHDSGML